MFYIRFCNMNFFFFSSRRRHTRCALVTGVQTCALPICVPAIGQHIVEEVAQPLAERDVRVFPCEIHWSLFLFCGLAYSAGWRVSAAGIAAAKRRRTVDSRLNTSGMTQPATTSIESHTASGLPNTWAVTSSKERTVGKEWFGTCSTRW